MFRFSIPGMKQTREPRPRIVCRSQARGGQYIAGIVMSMLLASAFARIAAFAAPADAPDDATLKPVGRW